ncbi:MAG TPA: hypothetical protein VIS74_05590 [Chthoniobacterales bacterium]
MVTTPFWRGLASVAIAALFFVATSWLLQVLLPPAIPQGVEEKLRFFAKHKDEFDTLIFGSSRIYYAISPEIFDKTTGENGIQTRTFNFGVNGMFPPETFYLLEQVLKTKPRNLKWVVIEMEEIQNKWKEHEIGTQRILYWHDWPRTALTLQKTLDPRGNAASSRKVARLWLARRQLATNIALFAKQFVNVGRGAALASSWGEYSSYQEEFEIGPKRDGYRLGGAAMSAERAASFQKILAQQVSDAQPRIIDPATDQAFRDSAALIRKVGANPVFVVTPIILQSPVSFRESPPAPLLVFNDSRKYPALFDTRVRIDEAHLTPEGSEEFTRLLAREFARQTRQP